MLNFKNQHIVYEKELICTVGENEYNYSQNPTVTTGSNGDYKSFVNTDDFSPYVTTIGLYNDNNELLAVAKVTQPTKISKTTDTTFIIKYDW